MDNAVHQATLLVHGWGSCFHDTWEATGITSLLGDTSRSCTVSSSCHGTAPKPTLHLHIRSGKAVRVALPDIPVDAVDFFWGRWWLDELVKSPIDFAAWYSPELVMVFSTS